MRGEQKKKEETAILAADLRLLLLMVTEGMDEGFSIGRHRR